MLFSHAEEAATPLTSIMLHVHIMHTHRHLQINVISSRTSLNVMSHWTDFCCFLNLAGVSSALHGNLKFWLSPLEIWGNKEIFPSCLHSTGIFLSWSQACEGLCCWSFSALCWEKKEFQVKERQNIDLIKGVFVVDRVAWVHKQPWIGCVGSGLLWEVCPCIDLTEINTRLRFI